ncbi:TRC40/GET3/ArsA family transport-energizing ATPase [Haloechinothrix sp. LS1_15]|uniref:ArsA family ATPase n=1 Tax=Haloechinothrix sp. LS1_15 TaxID=2652248 RepID=UPI00294ABA58|nr:TRC40/GET3/ArsA family transport-energizing ATPase [Haloechinothrix sp. LS1_15]
MLLTVPGSHHVPAPVVIIGGKGGVGKTTVAAATALALAGSGRRTLLVSTDPAHSLADVLGRPLGEAPRRVTEQLWAVEPDPEAMVRARIKQVGDDAAAALPRSVMPAVQRQLDAAAAAPGMAESALSDMLTRSLDQVNNSWEHVVVDSAPTGHLLRMLELPDLLTTWVRGLARQRERAIAADRIAGDILGSPEESDDPLLNRLHERRRRLERTATRLRTEACVHLVLLPRRMVLAETARAAATLTGGGFTLGHAVLNQTTSTSDSEFTERARVELAVPGIVRLPEVESEPIGIERLGVLGELLSQQGVPAAAAGSSTSGPSVDNR